MDTEMAAPIAPAGAMPLDARRPVSTVDEKARMSTLDDGTAVLRDDESVHTMSRGRMSLEKTA